MPREAHFFYCLTSIPYQQPPIESGVADSDALDTQLSLGRCPLQFYLELQLYFLGAQHLR